MSKLRYATVLLPNRQHTIHLSQPHTASTSNYLLIKQGKDRISVPLESVTILISALSLITAPTMGDDSKPKPKEATNAG